MMNNFACLVFSGVSLASVGHSGLEPCSPEASCPSTPQAAALSDATANLTPTAIGLTADWGEVLRRAAGYAAAYRFRTATFAADGSQRVLEHDDGVLELVWDRATLRIVRTSEGLADGDRRRGRLVESYSLMRGEFVSVQREVGGGCDNVLIDNMSAPPTLATVILGELPIAWRSEAATVDFSTPQRVQIQFKTREGAQVLVEMQALDHPLPAHWVFQRGEAREEFWLLGKQYDQSTCRSVPSAIVNIKTKRDMVVMAGVWLRTQTAPEAGAAVPDVQAGAVVFDARIPGEHRSETVDRDCAAIDLLSWMTIPIEAPSLAVPISGSALRADVAQTAALATSSPKSGASVSPDLFASDVTLGNALLPAARDALGRILPLLGAHISDASKNSSSPASEIEIPGLPRVRLFDETVPQIGSIVLSDEWPRTQGESVSVRVAEPALELTAPSGTWMATGSLHAALSRPGHARSIVRMRSGCALELLTPLPLIIGTDPSKLDFVMHTDRPLPPPGRALVWLDIDNGVSIEVPVSVEGIAAMVRVQPAQLAVRSGDSADLLLSSDSFEIVHAKWVRIPQCIQINASGSERMLWSVRSTPLAAMRHTCAPLLGVVHVRDPGSNGSPRAVNVSARILHERVLYGREGAQLVGGVFYRGERIQVLQAPAGRFELGFPDRLTSVYSSAIVGRQILATTTVPRDTAGSDFNWEPVTGVRVVGPILNDTAEPGRAWRGF